MLALANTTVEFDAKHTDSPLCACKECNAAWLARRSRPLTKKHTFEIKHTLNPEKKKEYADRFASHGVHLSLDDNQRAPCWRLMNYAKTWGTSTAFDLDLDRLLAQLNAGRTFPQLDLTFHATPVVKSTGGAPHNLTGGPFCAMCGEPATLFCPNMIKKAQLLNLRLFFPAGDARLESTRLHPGRCRKRLNDLIHAALVKQDGTTTK